MHWAGGCIPACIGQGVYPSMHAGQGGVCPGGGLPRRVCVCPGGYLPRGVSAWGGFAQGGGVSAQGNQRQTPPPEQNDRHVLKHFLAATSLRAVINIFSVGKIAIFVSKDTRITSISWQNGLSMKYV